MSDDGKLDLSKIPGSGQNQKSVESQMVEKIKQEAAEEATRIAAQKIAGQQGDEAPAEDSKDTKKFDLPEGFDVKKTAEFKKMRDQLLSEALKAQKAAEEASAKNSEFEKQLSDIAGKLKAKEREGLSEAEKADARVKDLEEKMLELLKQRAEDKAEIQARDEKAAKQQILANSELSPEYYEYIDLDGSPVEIQAKIDKFIDKLGDHARKTLEKVPQTVSTQQVGASPSIQVQNEGVQTAGQQAEAPKVDFSKLKNVKDFRDLETVFLANPELIKDLLS